MNDTSDLRSTSETESFLGAVRAVLAGWSSSGWPARITVAFSGGLDSTVLLAALRRLDLPVPLRAAHVDHSLHESSAEWSRRCAAVAAALGVEYVTARVEVERDGGHGLEAAARDARYAALRALLEGNEWLLTAHHADDQWETLLLRMLRGTGVRGLRGILPFGPFGSGALGRPLLKFTRAELEAQAAAWELSWLEDPSNRAPRHDRNRLRLNVLPALRARWPTAAHQAVRLAEQMGEAEQILEAVAATDASPLLAPWCLPRAVLAALEPARQRNLLRFLVRRAGLGVPSARKLDELREALLAARAGAHSLVRWSGGEGRVFRDDLYLLGPLPAPSPPDLRAKLDAARSWTGPEGRVELVAGDGPDALPDSWLPDLTLRFRAGGERIKPRGRQHHHTLKHVFQERGVVPWMRSRVPLVFRGELLVAVGDLWVARDADAAAAGEPRWRVQWTGHPPLAAPRPP